MQGTRSKRFREGWIAIRAPDGERAGCSRGVGEIRRSGRATGRIKFAERFLRPRQIKARGSDPRPSGFHGQGELIEPIHGDGIISQIVVRQAEPVTGVIQGSPRDDFGTFQSHAPVFGRSNCPRTSQIRVGRRGLCRVVQ